MMLHFLAEKSAGDWRRPTWSRCDDDLCLAIWGEAERKGC
jgi:hypothetical protein